MSEWRPPSVLDTSNPRTVKAMSIESTRRGPRLASSWVTSDKYVTSLTYSFLIREQKVLSLDGCND